MAAPDVVVVGGGPAGSSAASRLADAGARVVLIEREPSAHHKVCGEFLSEGAAHQLEQIGVRLAGLGAEPVEKVRLVCGKNVAEAALPFRGSSLSRFILDEELLNAAADRGVDIRRGVWARSSMSGRSRTGVHLSDGTVIQADAMFLATGKHNFRGHPRNGGTQNDLIGFKMNLETTSALLDRSVEILLFDGGYAGLQPVGREHLNLCLLIRRGTYQALGRSWENVVRKLVGSSPRWRHLLAGMRQSSLKPLSIYGTPFGYVTEPHEGPVFRLGDQMAVTPSFTGEGIALALSSAQMASEAFLEHGANARDYHRRVIRRFGGGVHTAALASQYLSHPWMQNLAVRAAENFPAALRWSAEATRVAT